MWAYNDKSLVIKASRSVPKKKVIKKKKVSPYQFKLKELKWFVTDLGKRVVPSPIEDRIRTILNGFGVKFYTEVSFAGLNPTGTITGYLRYDFYIPSKKIAIEYQGKEYHRSEDVKKRDKLKYLFCKVNGIWLQRYKAKDLDTIDEQIYKLLMK